MTGKPRPATCKLESSFSTLGSLSKQRELAVLKILFEHSVMHVGQISSNVRGDNNMYIQQTIDDLLEYGLIQQVDAEPDQMPYVHAYKLSMNGFGIVSLKNFLDSFDKISEEETKKDE